MTKDIARLGLDVHVVCLNWCSDELFVELAGDAAEGVIAASPFAFPGTGTELEAEVRGWAEANGKDVDALGVHYLQGWATMKAMMDAIVDVAEAGDEITGANIKAALERYDGYDAGGLMAPLTYTADNHTGNTSLRLFRVEGGKHVPITDYISAN